MFKPCFFGSRAHCQVWRELAERCDADQGAACEELGLLLIEQPPMQPLWGAIALERGCELGRDAGCERGARIRSWYALRRHEPTPDPEVSDRVGRLDDLDRACDAHDPVACAVREQNHWMFGEPIDVAAAMRACEAGFRDLCGVVAQGTRDTPTQIAAILAGCNHADAYLCLTLSVVYSGESCEFGICPPRDAGRVAAYLAVACALDPEVDRRCPNHGP